MPFCKALFFIPLVAPMLPFTESFNNAASKLKPALSIDDVGSTPKPVLKAKRPNGEKAPAANLPKAFLPV